MRPKTFSPWSLSQLKKKMNALLITEGKQNLYLVIKKNKDQVIIYNSHSTDYIELKEMQQFLSLNNGSNSLAQNAPVQNSPNWLYLKDNNAKRLHMKSL